jgi:hypothetical protein
MILVTNLTAPVDARISNIMGKVMRGHVSRFPVIAHYRANSEGVSFCDSRFPTNEYVGNINKSIATLVVEKDEKGRDKYTVSCREIQNERYSSTNIQYNTKETTNPDVVVKLLKTYAKPFSAKRIEQMHGKEGMYDSHRKWQNEIEGTYQTLMNGIKVPQLVEELTKQRNMGVKFFNKDIQQLADEGADLLGERKKRNTTGLPVVFVYMNPDESWIVHDVAEREFQNFDALPEYVRDKLALLRMVEPQVFVPECGFKHNANSYRIYGGTSPTGT